MSTARRIFLSVLFPVIIVLIWRATRVEDPRAEFLGQWRFSGLMISLGATWCALAAWFVAVGPGRQRHRAFGVIALSMAMVVILGLLEALTLFGHDWQGSFGTRPVDAFTPLRLDQNQADPELIHLHWPNTEFRGQVLGNLVEHFQIPDAQPYAVDVRYDGRGFRNDRDYERAAVAVIGDSFVEAARLPLADTLVKRLERDLEQDVVNLGQSAYGFRQELEVLKRFALPLQPGTVVWMLFGGNDFRDVSMYEELRLNADLHRREDPFVKRMFLRNALRLLARLIPREREPSADDRKHAGVLALAGGAEETIWFSGPTEPWTDRDWQVGTSTLLEARELCARAGTRFLVCYIPRKYDAYRGLVALGAGDGARGWEDPGLDTALTRFCNEHELAWLDLTPLLRAAIKDGRSPFLRDDVHFNALGQEIAARAIAAQLRSAASSPSPTTPGNPGSQPR
ncbi:MAG: hypothetical protein KDB53_08075 [Planctomycetes bacterium]|nr:hypothetical protein [Planctomycetota bacterium]